MAKNLPETGIIGWLTTVDHKRIGILYAMAALGFLLMGGTEAMMMRTQLIMPNNGFASAALFNGLVTMHGTTMIFLFVMPMSAAFFNFLTPLMIGAPDVAFPRLNALSYWIFLFGGLLLNFSFVADMIPGTGWFGYANLTEIQFSPTHSVDFWALGIQIAGLASLIAAINFFVTSNARENDTGPGAEYVLLVLQLLTGSDRLANSLQTSSFVILLISINVLVRYMRAPRALRLPLVLLFGTVPSFVLQATTTQNDLCAAVAALAVVSALRKPLFGDVLKMKPRDGVAIGLSVASGYLIKPTALMFVAPFLLVAAVRFALAAVRGRKLAIGTLIKPVGAALLTCVLLCGPHVIRKSMYRGVVGATESEVTFPLSSGWLRARRVANPLFAVAHHVPWKPLNRALEDLHTAATKIDPPGRSRGGIDGFYTGHVWSQYEDLAGAPFQFVAAWTFIAFGLVWAAVRRRGVRTALGVMLFPAASWLIFHWVARNNQWIARYHAPWFALAVLSACWACHLARVSGAARVALVAATWGMALLAVPYAWSTVMANERRPVSSTAMNKFDRARSYYSPSAALEAEHTRVLDAAAETSCSSIVLLLGNDDEMEYQLTWRAMQRGLQIHHSPGPAEGCLLFAPHGLSSEKGANKVWKVLRADQPLIFVRR